MCLPYVCLCGERYPRFKCALFCAFAVSIDDIALKMLPVPWVLPNYCRKQRHRSPATGYRESKLDRRESIRSSTIADITASSSRSIRCA